MKFLNWIVCAIFVLSVSDSYSQNKKAANASAKKTVNMHQKENDFGKAVLKALQDKNLDAWIALYPDNDEYAGILQAGLAVKAEGLTQQLIDEMLAKRKKEAAAAYAKQFKQYCAMADSVGVVWSKAVFQKFDFNTVHPEPVKLKYLDATLWFACGKRHFAIDGIQAVEIASGYKLQSVSAIMNVDDGD